MLKTRETDFTVKTSVKILKDGYSSRDIGQNPNIQYSTVNYRLSNSKLQEILKIFKDFSISILDF